MKRNNLVRLESISFMSEIPFFLLTLLIFHFFSPFWGTKIRFRTFYFLIMSVWRIWRLTEATTGSALQKNVFLEMLQNSGGNTCARDSFLTFLTFLLYCQSKIFSSFVSFLFIPRVSVLSSHDINSRYSFSKFSVYDKFLFSD